MTPSVLAIDPGGTTGWAFIGPGQLILHTGVITGNVKANRFPQNHVRNALASLKVKYHPDAVVVERMPLKLQPGLREIVEACEAVFPQRHLIGPGEWKPVAGKVKLPQTMETQHQKDAYRMGRFYLFKFWDVPL